MAPGPPGLGPGRRWQSAGSGALQACVPVTLHLSLTDRASTSPPSMRVHVSPQGAGPGTPRTHTRPLPPAPHRSRQPGTGQGPGARGQATGYTGRACGTHEAHASAHLVPGHGALSQVLAPVASPPAPCFLTRDVGTKVTTCCRERKMALNGVEVPQNAKFPSDPGATRTRVGTRCVRGPGSVTRDSPAQKRPMAVHTHPGTVRGAGVRRPRPRAERQEPGTGSTPLRGRPGRAHLQRRDTG